MTQTTPSGSCPSPRASWRLGLAALALLAACHKSGSGPVAPPGSPATPTNVTAVASGYSIRVRWQDNSSDETGFKIRRLADGQPWATVATVAADVTEYLDSGLKSTTIYYYRVVATNAAGDSLESNTAWDQTATPSRGGYGCALVLGHDPSADPAPAFATSPPAQLWMWALPDGHEQVVAAASFPGPRETATLDGGAAGTAWLTFEREHRATVSVYDFTVRFSPLAPDADGTRSEFCFMLHDMRRGDYETSGLHAAARVKTTAQLPVLGAFPVEPDRLYRVLVVVDTEREVFDLSLDGLRIARDVPLDGVVAGPTRYVHR